MRYRHGWDFPALVTLLERLHMHEAEAVDRAVIRFAETGEGRLTRVAPYYRLRAGAHDALLTIDHEAQM